MRLHRFYIEKRIGNEGEISLTDHELIHQMLNVFRFQAGQQIILFDGSGAEYLSEIILISKKEISFKILSVEIKKVSNKKVSLYLSLIKKNNFEWACEKCTEIGVSEIHPIISERSEKKDLNLERLNKIVKEASEQSGRVILPQIFSIKNLDQAVSQVVKEGMVGVVFCPTAPSSECHPALSKAGIGRSNKVAAFIGPEGGWSEKEIELFKKNNFEILSLGQNILRAETAAIVSSSLFLIL